MISLDNYIKELKLELKEGALVKIFPEDEWSDGLRLSKDKIIYIRITPERGQENSHQLTLNETQEYLEKIANYKMDIEIEKQALKNFLES